MIYSTATVPVNPQGETKLTREQVWKGLELKARDARDSGRVTAPLTQAADALTLDTSAMDIDEAIAAAIALAEERLG